MIGSKVLDERGEPFVQPEMCPPFLYQVNKIELDKPGTFTVIQLASFLVSVRTIRERINRAPICASKLNIVS